MVTSDVPFDGSNESAREGSFLGSNYSVYDGDRDDMIKISEMGACLGILMDL